MPFEDPNDGLSKRAHDMALELEYRVQDRFDFKRDDETATSNLIRCWGSMTQAEKNETAKALDHDFNNHKWNTLPIPTVTTDENGDCVCIYFKPSKLDFHNKVKSVSVGSNHEISTSVGIVY